MYPPLRNFARLVFLVGLICSRSAGQSGTTVPSIPRLISYSATAKDSNGKPLTGIIGVTFALYSDETGGVPVWSEIQNVQADSGGRYTATLGATQTDGLPLDVFTNAQARWLEVQVEGQPAKPRTLLLSVPYALKAGDAQTIGGLPPSAFVLAGRGASAASAADTVSATGSSPSTVSPPLGGSGTLNFVPLWTPDGNTLGNSVLFQSGSGTSAKMGVNNSSPSTTLDVKGAATIRGLLALPAAGTASATAGKNSQALKLSASAFSSSTKTAVNQNFQWQAETVNNNTANPSGTLNLLFSAGAGQPAETGLKISNTGLVTFTSGQTFPGAGTITGVTAGGGLTGGGTGGDVTLSLDTNQVPQLNVGNIFTGNQTVNGNLSATGVVTGSSYQIGSDLFAFGNMSSQNAFLGFAGNTTATGSQNTGTGGSALMSDTLGYGNTADGNAALTSNTEGNFNTASGNGALFLNTLGNSNTASGYNALVHNTTGSYNTALGFEAGPDPNSPNLTNATAIGANAVVSQSNAVVLGGTGAYAVKVGIGTATPAATLDVRGNSNFTGLITFASNQSFPNTISGVTAGSGLTGGGTSGNVSLGLLTSCASGQVLQWNGASWVCSSAGTGTISGVTAGTALTGGGSSGSITLNVDTTQVPLLNTANTFTGNQTANGNLSATGVVSGSSYQIGSDLFAFGSRVGADAFLGFSGGSTMGGIGTNNTALGVNALQANTSGSSNTALGSSAMYSNTTGMDNLAIGMNTLGATTVGNSNTAVGNYALNTNFTGSYNSAFGFDAGHIYNSLSYVTLLGAYANAASDNLTNATAIGANATVNKSNALVLGSINGVNGATANTNVGIGTNTPQYALDVHGTANFTGLVTFSPNQTFSGAGTITGVTAGSGLTGGGTSGTVSLGLTTSCASSQVLQWNGAGWVCSSAGTGTITGVTAGTGLTGGGSSGGVTVSVDTTKVPQLATANTFIGDQTVNGNLSATGVVTASSFQIGSNLFAFGNRLNGNSFLGFAGNTNSTAAANTGVGAAALAAINSGTGDTAVGGAALYSNTSGQDNTAVGLQALQFNTTGSFNTAAGGNALSRATTENNNTAVGYDALGNISGGGDNTATGAWALYLNGSSYNSAFGKEALYSNTTGYSNTASGRQALYSNTTGFGNTVSGDQALFNNSTGNNNTALGNGALFKSTGQNNTAVGNGALYYLFAGDNNTAIGNNAESGYPAPHNTTAIGANAEVLVDNAMVLGSINGVNGATADTMVGIGTTSPGNILTIGQGKGHAIADGWDTYSSRRWKSNIHPLTDALGKVEQLRGVSYDLKQSGKHEIGVIAEEVGAVVPEVVTFEENGKDARGVDYSRLTALLIEAVKQQQSEIQQQRAQIQTQLRQMAEQQRQIARLNGKVGALESAVRTTRYASGKRKATLAHNSVAKSPAGE